MRGKPTRGRRRIQMLHDLVNNDGYVVLKWAAENWEGRTHRERMPKTCCTAEDIDTHLLTTYLQSAATTRYYTEYRGIFFTLSNVANNRYRPTLVPRQNQRKQRTRKEWRANASDAAARIDYNATAYYAPAAVITQTWRRRFCDRIALSVSLSLSLSLCVCVCVCVCFCP